MSEQNREFEAVTAVETTAGSFAFVGGLIVGSHVYEDLTHFPATNTNWPQRTAQDWHPTTVETGAVFVAPAVVAALATAALTSLTRRFIHNHR